MAHQNPNGRHCHKLQQAVKNSSQVSGSMKSGFSHTNLKFSRVSSNLKFFIWAGSTSEKEFRVKSPFQKRVFDTKFFIGAASRPKVVKCLPASYTRFKIQYDSNEGTICLRCTAVSLASMSMASRLITCFTLGDQCLAGDLLYQSY